MRNSLRTMAAWAGAVAATTMSVGASAQVATTVQIGASGKTFASSAAQCASDAAGTFRPKVQAGLFNPKRSARADVSLDGSFVARVTADAPETAVWLSDGEHRVVVALNRANADSYRFVVPAGLCAVPDTSGNTFSADGTLEYAASGKSYASVTPGCALSPTSGQLQPYVHLIDNGGYLLNVSVNGVPLTQLSATRPHTPVFLGPGLNVISAANGSLSTDYYVRDGGDGRCTL